MKCIGMALLSFVLTTLFFSCVKEQGRDECSLGYYIVLGIRDKNFSNINTITGLQPKSEQLAFRQYVSSLPIVWRTGNPEKLLWKQSIRKLRIIGRL